MKKMLVAFFGSGLAPVSPSLPQAQHGEACAFAHRACSIACDGCFRRVRLQCQVHDGCAGIGTCPDNMAATSPALHSSTSNLRVRRCREGLILNADRFFFKRTTP